LGHGTRESVHTPQRVETFAQHGLKVVDAAIGETHAMAITSINLEANSR